MMLALLGIVACLAFLGWIASVDRRASVAAWEDMRCGIRGEASDPAEMATRDLIRDTARALRRRRHI